MVLCSGPWRDRNHGTHTQWQGMAFKKYIYDIKRARGESMRSWINRSDEALMDMRKKLATAPGANSSESTMIPPQTQGWLLLHKARLRYKDIVGVMTMTGGSLKIKLVVKSLLDLFTGDVLQSVDRSYGKDSGNPRKQQDDDAYLDEDPSENDDPYIDENRNFLANEQIVSDIDDDLVLDNEEYHEALLGYREARDLMKEARVARGFYPVVVPIHGHIEFRTTTVTDCIRQTSVVSLWQPHSVRRARRSTHLEAHLPSETVDSSDVECGFQQFQFANVPHQPPFELQCLELRTTLETRDI